jgi:hypothetical protein
MSRPIRGNRLFTVSDIEPAKSKQYCQSCGSFAGEFTDEKWSSRGHVCDRCLQRAIGIDNSSPRLTPSLPCGSCKWVNDEEMFRCECPDPECPRHARILPDGTCSCKFYGQRGQMQHENE